MKKSRAPANISMLAPLQLLDYAVDHISYDQTRPEEGKPHEAAEAAGLGFKMEFQVLEDDEVFHLQLQVDVNTDSTPDEVEGHIYHRGSIKVSGWFAWLDKEITANFDNPKKLLLVNGMSILFGIIRNQFIHITESGPSPKLMLPSVSFLPLVDQWLSQNETDE